MKNIVMVMSIALAFVSAALWFWSAIMRIELRSTYRGKQPPEVLDKMSKQSKLNAAAAATTGLSALLQGVALWMQ